MAAPALRQTDGCLYSMPDLLTEITRAAKAYYAKAGSLPLTATDFYDWMATLPAARQAEVMAQGFVGTQAEPDFLRYCLENWGYGMWGYMARELSVDAFLLWETNGQFNGDLPPHGIAR